MVGSARDEPETSASLKKLQFDVGNPVRQMLRLAMVSPLGRLVTPTHFRLNQFLGLWSICAERGLMESTI